MAEQDRNPVAGAHDHDDQCGHLGIQHGDHIDYLNDGRLEHQVNGHTEEHILEVAGLNPNNCTPGHDCGAHDRTHQHGPGCGHEAVPHGDHVDYLVHGHLHHPHRDHCDDHGPVSVVGASR